MPIALKLVALPALFVGLVAVAFYVYDRGWFKR